MRDEILAAGIIAVFSIALLVGFVMAFKKDGDFVERCDKAGGFAINHNSKCVSKDVLIEP